jgi:hypothetical protein
MYKAYFSMDERLRNCIIKERFQLKILVKPFEPKLKKEGRD